MSLKLNIDTDKLTAHEKAKIFLFARWVATNYSSTQLNAFSGMWWLSSMKHFEDIVLGNYRDNGLYADTVSFIAKHEGKLGANTCTKCGELIMPEVTVCEDCAFDDNEFPF